MNETLGPTGKFPDGKISETDEGEIQIAIGEKDGCVILTFGKEISWMGMPPNTAKNLAASLIKHAANIERREKSA